MISATAGQQNYDFPPAENISFVDFDETSGGAAVMECPRNVIVRGAFKAGTEPTNPCPLHSPQMAPPPALDMFGNPIALDTSGILPVDPGGMPPLTDTTLTGGVFRTDTAPPPPVPQPIPQPQPQPMPQPPPQPQPQELPPPSQPQPSTNTSAPPESTNTVTPPPATTTTNPPDSD